MPTISIVIPVRNCEEYLHGCLDSVLGQTMSDIEVICVDDHSQDGSLDILRDIAGRDSRVRVIAYPENRSASQARKDGVLASRGEYIMFVDSDDTLALDACEKLHEAMCEQPVDILHFGTEIENAGNLPENRVEAMRAFVAPYAGTLEGERVFEGCFDEQLYNFSLWNKLFSAELCKRSFARVKDGSFPKAQDKYAYFLLSYHAVSYRGVPDLILYHYYFGRGITGHNRLSLEQFKRFCTMADVADAIREFLVEESAFDRYAEVYACTRDRLLSDCVANWTRHVDAGNRAAAFDLMLARWQSPEVVAKIAEMNWAKQGEVARLLQPSQAIAPTERDVRVVGTYYHKYANGGVQRVLSKLIELWLDMGYQVVLFTDVPPSEDDYELPDGVTRVVITAAADVGPKTYSTRATELHQAIVASGVDVMVYHAWVNNLLLWDLLICRAASVPFVVHCHNVFSLLLRNSRSYFADMPSVYRLCDTVVTLSDVDASYWGNFNGNVVKVVNPLTFDLEGTRLAELGGKNVLWLARVSAEKRPHDALRVFRDVLDEEPDARLFMVGTSDNEEYLAGVTAMVEELGIQDSVVMCGFHKEVLPFYQAASVFLMTSEFEGFPLTLVESQSAGVPCVMYDLPYLTLTQARQGILSVEMGDTVAAARAVVSLLGDDDYRRRLGREARQNIETIAEFDFAGTWRQVFEAIGRPRGVVQVDETTSVMWATLLSHYRHGAESRNREIVRLKKKVTRQSHDLRDFKRVRAQLKRTRRSRSFRLGRALTYIPRKLKSFLRGRANQRGDA